MIAQRLWQRWHDPRLQSLVDQAVVSGSSFLSAVIVARELPEKGFGQFSLAFLTCLFLSNMHRAGLTQPLNVIAATADSDRLDRHLAALLRAHLVVVPLAAFLLTVASLFLFQDALLAAAAIAYVACFALQETLRRYWYTRRAISAALWNDLISYVGQVVALLVLAAAGWLHAWTAFLAMAATSLLAFLVGMPRKIPSQRTPPMGMQELLAEHWPLSKWLLLTVLAVWGAGQVYPLLIVPLGVDVVAAFAACRNLLNIMSPLVQSVGNYIPAHAAAVLQQRGKVAVRRQIRRTCIWAFAAGAVFLALIQVAAEPLLHVLYAGRYNQAAPLLRILAFGTVCALFGAILGAYALALQDSRSNFLSNLGATVTTFTVGIWLIDARGVEGASLGAVLSIATAMLLQGVFLRQRLRQLPD